MVAGDHNSPREHAVNRKAVLFFCRAFRCSPVPQHDADGSLAQLLGFDAQELDAAYDHRVVGRLALHQAARLLSEAGLGKLKPTMGARLKASFPFRAEGTLQLKDKNAQAGFCFTLLPLPSEWAGVNRPPTVLFAFASVYGLELLQAVEGRQPEVVARSPFELDVGVPILCILQLLVQKATYRLRFALSTGALELEYALGEEYDAEVILQSCYRGGEAQFFDVELIDLAQGSSPSQESEELGDVRPAITESSGPANASHAHSTSRTDCTEATQPKSSQGFCNQQ